ncbi:MAG: Glu-tRNA(Gln) amidotransferase GatDE subunit E [candidate division Zixibacteria bacterium HGW-Zixibacteria-1]|nr:MAG: Glu-tRNA(Gln) amidotransferase GatDE subunit E [candidate division Zixibacteria bacterium HGW-Zixibacteria-1]
MSKNDFELKNYALLKSLGFKCGLEIHQQLNTKNKLFCHCPVGLTGAPHDAEILRHMRPTLSELGEYDGTALMEFKTKKNVIYRLYRERTCTYEMDDTPPFLVNQEAVDIAIKLALLFNCKIVDELHVIRKQYLDGSIPTGFQRTMIIGIDGWVPFKGKKIEISQVNLEEEACREVSDIGHCIVFATDRLSIPLVEIITGADMKDPGEAAEVCRLLGNAMKVTGLVRRGIGTVRQDVNVSITGGDRVEIKGVHKVGNIPDLTASEAYRQQGLLELKNIFREHFPKPGEIPYDEAVFTLNFSGTANQIGRRLESDHPLKVVGLKLPRMVDIISYMLQPGRDFGFELSGRVRVIACIDTRPNLFFYSQREKYDIPEELWNNVVDELKPERGDDIVLICGPSEDITTAINEIKIRISELASGVPNETRQDIKDGTTDFERILPGPDRMYPDTDHPPVRIAGERVDALRTAVGEPLWEKHRRWSELGLHEEQVKALSLSRFADLFDRLAKECSDKEYSGYLKKMAHICTGLFVGLRRRGYDLTKCDTLHLSKIIKGSFNGNWSYNKLKQILILAADGIIDTEASEMTLTDDEFNAAWKSSLTEFAGRNSNNSKDKFRRYFAGKLLARYTDVRDILTRIDARLASTSSLS